MIKNKIYKFKSCGWKIIKLKNGKIKIKWFSK